MRIRQKILVEARVIYGWKGGRTERGTIGKNSVFPFGVFRQERCNVDQSPQ
jgi:hypothetical protein